MLAAGDKLPGLLGSVAALLTVTPGAEVALAAALGPIADAVAVEFSTDKALPASPDGDERELALVARKIGFTAK